MRSPKELTDEENKLVDILVAEHMRHLGVKTLHKMMEDVTYALIMAANKRAHGDEARSTYLNLSRTSYLYFKQKMSESGYLVPKYSRGGNNRKGKQ